MIGAYSNDQLIHVKRTPNKWGTMTEKKEAFFGRIEFRRKLVRNLQGEMVVSTAKVMAPKALTIGVNDQISYKSKQYQIINYEEVKNFSTQFIKVDLA